MSRREVSLAEFLSVWLRVAALSFGGPAGQIAVMHRIVVDEKKWIDERRFLHALNYCMLLPGPEAQQLATYIGWLMRGMTGGLIAGGLFVLPGFLSILALSVIYALYRETPFVQAIFFGLQAAILAVVVEAVLRIGRRVLKNYAMVAIAATAFVAVFFFRLPFPLLVIGAGILGAIGGRLRPDLFYVLKEHGGDKTQDTDHLIDYDAAHTQPNAMRAAAIILLASALWFGPLLLMQQHLGREHVYAQEGWFFSKVSLVTFGGAYAVLPYVADQAEKTYGWVTPEEMMAGLGMAETTPGPLIQVVQFVGFLGAFKSSSAADHDVAGALQAGLIGSLIVNWVTYLPCFLWIFLGAPYIERLRGHRSLNCALSAITAAVVGVVLNLAVWFSLKALFGPLNDVATYRPLILHTPRWLIDPQYPVQFSWTTLLLALASAMGLFYFKRTVIEVLLGAILIGAGLWALGAR
jgi:chromate transporter